MLSTASVATRRAALLLAFLVVAGTATANAAEVSAVKLEDKAKVAGQELLLNGAGLRTRVVFKVYVASLYVPRRATDLKDVLTQSPRRIQLDILRTLSAQQLIDALDEGLAENNSVAELAAVKDQRDELASTMKSFNEVREHDVITLDFVEGGTRIGLNGQSKRTIAGEPFNQALTRVWLGEHPVQADLKKSLLGG